MNAASLGLLDAVEVLVASGASVLFRDKDGSSAWCCVYKKADAKLKKAVEGKSDEVQKNLIASFDAKAKKMYDVLNQAGLEERTFLIKRKRSRRPLKISKKEAFD